MAEIVLKKHPLTRTLHYLFLLPFVPSLRPLLVNYRPVDMGVYLGGIVLVLFLVIYSNIRPLVVAQDGALKLFLHYRHEAEIHPYQEIVGFRRLSRSRVSIHSLDHSPVTLKLSRKNTDALIGRLNQVGLHAIED